MEHENEILGTFMVVAFDLFVAFFLYLVVHVSNVKTGWGLILFLICLVLVGCWATFKVGKYWFDKIKSKIDGGKEKES